MSLKERIEADTAIAVANALKFERHRQQTLETVKEFFLERPYLFGSCHLSQYLPEELQVLNPLPARWEKELANFDEDVDILLVSLQVR
ncbi:MAG: hypothetical protein KVP17_000637 [Porospora cf. gigantea B]|uniref:uncharacterized protein n=1 Tax=Porospora cf. gigantea B TaxID=2853592 RepID=UPI0035718E26|nr:MAG: hypothetical protein KVP17_000637 [Porospora cf. gigantea B]